MRSAWWTRRNFGDVADQRPDGNVAGPRADLGKRWIPFATGTEGEIVVAIHTSSSSTHRGNAKRVSGSSISTQSRTLGAWTVDPDNHSLRS